MRQRYSSRYASNSQTIYAHFLKTLLSEIRPKFSLVVSIRSRSLIEEFPFPPGSQYERKILDWSGGNLELDRQDYEFLYGEFPMGPPRAASSAVRANIDFKMSAEWYYIFSTIKHLSQKGLAVFPIVPAIFYPSKSKKFAEFMKKNGFCIDATFELPAIFSPETEFCPYLVLIKRGASSDCFVADSRNPEHHSSIVSNYLRKHDSGSLMEGTIVQKEDFISFPKYRADSELKILQKQFSEFKQVSIKDVAITIKQVYKERQFTHKPNSVYFPKVGNSDVLYRIEDCSMQHKNYYQIELSDQVLSGYFSYIFKSKLGAAIQDTLKVGMAIERISKELLENAAIPLPDLNTQQEILGASDKIQSLKNKLGSIEEELSVNPLDHNNLFNKQVDNLIRVTELEGNVQKIRRLVRGGESKTLELKQSFSFHVEEKKKDMCLEKACLKTIVGFLNTDGGELVVGVKNDGGFYGLETEISKFHKGSEDRFLLYLQDKIKNRIGGKYYPYIDCELINVDKNCTVLLVSCKPSETECYLDGKHFYVRVNPATHILEGPELVDYVRKRFTK